MSSLVLQAPPGLLWRRCLSAGLAESCGHHESPGGTDGSWGSAEGSSSAAVLIWGMFVKGNWCFEQLVPRGECRSLVWVLELHPSSPHPMVGTRPDYATYGTWGLSDVFGLKSSLSSCVWGQCFVASPCPQWVVQGKMATTEVT